jgi:poly-gamma-glutamate synthesis protein (capsule biosynthesis protein)
VHGESAINLTALSSLKKFFADGNLNIFNLETAVTDKTQREEKQYNFKTQPKFLEALKSIGFNVATIANNHSYDYGNEGFLDTIRNLDKVGIAYVGGGINSVLAYKGRVFKVKNVRIGILGFAKVNGGPASIAGKNRPGTTNGYDLKATELAITEMKKVSDVIIVLAHWGEEGSFCPRTAEEFSAKRWFARGADIIVGSHTHTLQPITFSQNKLLAYSMGNFIFYSSAIENRRTAILKVKIDSNRKISYTLQRFEIDNLTKVPVPSNYDRPIGCETPVAATNAL